MLIRCQRCLGKRFHPSMPAKCLECGGPMGEFTEFQLGYIRALVEYAWWKNGEQFCGLNPIDEGKYVGCGTTTLVRAVARAPRSEEDA